MSMLGVNGALIGAYQYAASKDVTKADAGGTNFIDQLKQTGEMVGLSKVDAYQNYLKQKYGVGVSIQNVGKDQSSMDRIGAGNSFLWYRYPFGWDGHALYQWRFETRGKGED